MTANRDGARRELVHARASSLIIRCFFDCYNELGFGYLEPIYARAMEILLKECGLQVDREFPIPVMFRGQQIGFHRCDLLVERAIIVELKATDYLPPHCERQTRNYLKGLKKELGFVLHLRPPAEVHPRRAREPQSGKKRFRKFLKFRKFGNCSTWPGEQDYGPRISRMDSTTSPSMMRSTTSIPSTTSANTV